MDRWIKHRHYIVNHCYPQQWLADESIVFGLNYYNLLSMNTTTVLTTGCICLFVYTLILYVHIQILLQRPKQWIQTFFQGFVFLFHYTTLLVHNNEWNKFSFILFPAAYSVCRNFSMNDLFRLYSIKQTKLCWKMFLVKAKSHVSNRWKFWFHILQELKS